MRSLQTPTARLSLLPITVLAISCIGSSTPEGYLDSASISSNEGRAALERLRSRQNLEYVEESTGEVRTVSLVDIVPGETPVLRAPPKKIRRWLNLGARVLPEPERPNPEARGPELRSLRRDHRRGDRWAFHSG